MVLVQLGRSPSTVFTQVLICDSKEITSGQLAGQLRCTALAQAFYDAQNRLRIRQRAGLIGLAEADHSFLIDDEDSPYRGAPLLVPQVIRLRYLAFGMPIRQLGIRQSAQRKPPGAV